MAKNQKRWMAGATYNLEGPSKKTRKLKHVGTMTVKGKRYLIFRELRRSPKVTTLN